MLWRSGTTKRAPNGATVVAVVVVGRIDATTVEVQVVAVGITIRGRGPVVAAVTEVVLRPIIAVDVPGTRTSCKSVETALRLETILIANKQYR